MGPSSQLMPSHFKSSIACRSAFGLMRGPSRSSMRRMIFQPRWRARSELTRNVRALPRCNAPVGDGARRVVGIEAILLESWRLLFGGGDWSNDLLLEFAI